MLWIIALLYAPFVRRSFMESDSVVAVFEKTWHWIPSWANIIQSTLLCTTSLIQVLILLCHLSLYIYSDVLIMLCLHLSCSPWMLHISYSLFPFVVVQLIRRLKFSYRELKLCNGEGAHLRQRSRRYVCREISQISWNSRIGILTFKEPPF